MVLWSAEAEARLFACVLHLKDIKLSKEDLDNLSKLMNGEFSAEAIRQRITKKIKKSFDEVSPTKATAASPKGTDKSPKKARSWTALGLHDTLADFVQKKPMGTITKPLEIIQFEISKKEPASRKRCATDHHGKGTPTLTLKKPKVKDNDKEDHSYPCLFEQDKAAGTRTLTLKKPKVEDNDKEDHSYPCLFEQDKAE